MNNRSTTLSSRPKTAAPRSSTATLHGLRGGHTSERPPYGFLACAFLATAIAPRVATVKALADPPAAPSIVVAVDPRVELMSIIFRLAGHPEYNQGRVESYTNDVERHFGAQRDHAVVKLARDLRRTRGVSYDACMSLAVHIGDASRLDERIPFDPHPEALDERWTVSDAREFLRLARQFQRETRFADFFDDHADLYQTAVSRMQKVLTTKGKLEWFDEFFGTRPEASFTLALGMLNGPACYGPRMRAADGREELYCVLGVWETDRKGMPRFEKSMLNTVVHEFCHSYTNSLVDKYESDLESAGERIFPYVEEAMKRQAYGNWKTRMYESLVRGCVVRYTFASEGFGTARKAVQYQVDHKFLWMGELSNLLADYERERGRYPTLDAFFPRIVAFFDQQADTLVPKLQAEDAKRPKVISMTPPNGATDVDPGLKALVIRFDRPMTVGSFSIVGGGPHFPEITRQVAYDSTGKVLTVPVKLEPEWSYEFWLNSDRFTNFRSRDGEPLAPIHMTFQTGSRR